MSIFSRNSDRVIAPPAKAAEARTPLQILAARYARGEVGREEFQQIRRDLLDQEALAHLAGDSQTGAIDSLALVDTVTPNATLLGVASFYVAVSPGMEAGRILAGLIRALYLDGSAFQFDLLERLNPEQRAWAEGLIKAKLEHLIPLDEWERAYDVVRDFEHQTEPTAPTNDDGATGKQDWDSMLREAENFLNNGKSKRAPSIEPGDALGGTANQGTAMVEAPPVSDAAVVVEPREAVIADPPVSYAPVAEMPSYSAVAISPPLPRKRNDALRYGVAGLVIIGIAALAVNVLRSPPAAAPTQARSDIESLPAKTDAAMTGPTVNVTDVRQQSAGQILVPQAGTATGEPHPGPDKPVVQPNLVEKQPPVAETPAPSPAVLTVTPAPAVAPLTVEDRPAKTPRSEPIKIATVAPTKNHGPAAPPAKAVPAHPVVQRAAPAKEAAQGAAPVNEAAPAPTVATPAQASGPPVPPGAEVRSPVQVAALAPVLRPAPETRPALRPEDIEAWSGGEDSLQQGVRNYQSGNYKDATENLQKAIEAGLRVKRNTVTAHKLLALSHCALGRENQCRQEFQQALRIDPSLTLGADEAAVPSAGAVFGSAKSAQAK